MDSKLMQWKIDRQTKTYLNTNRFYSDPKVWMFMLTGGRGIGKTTNIVADCIDDFKKRGNEFVYVRRYKTEIVKCKELLQPIVSDTNIKGIGNGIFQYECKKVRIGYGCALSLQASYKSGIDFSKVNTIVFDEAILMPGGRYLPNECTTFLELLSTIVRTRVGYRVFILGNNLDLFNPYYEYFNIPRFEDRYVDRERGICCENLKHRDELIKKEQETPLYRLTKGTEYGNYHYENEVLVENKGTICIKPKEAELTFRIVVNDFTLNVYRCGVISLYIELREKVIKDDRTFVLYENTKPNYLYIKMLRESDERYLLYNAFYDGVVMYNNKQAIGVFAMIMDEVL